MREVWMPGGVRTEVHVTAQDTGGAFCLLVDEPPAGWSLPTHRHAGAAETIHVVEGEFELVIEARRLMLGPGATGHVPAGAPHSSAGTGRRVVLFSPGGMERFFLEVGAASPQEKFDSAAVLAAAERHGWRF